MRVLRTVALLVIILVPLCASAQEQQIVRIEGVQFYCDGCIVLDEEFCGVPQGQQSLVLPCTKVFDYLLKVNRDMGLLLPSSRELVQYTVHNKVDSKRVKNILQTLLERNHLRLFSSAELLGILRGYPQEMQELLADGWGDTTFVERIWSLLRGNYEPVLLGSKALAFARAKNVSMQELLQELSASSPQVDVNFLSTASTFAVQFDSALSEQLLLLLESVEQCVEVELAALRSCKQLLLQAENSVLQSYISKLLLEQVASFIRPATHSLNATSEALALLPLEFLSESQLQEIALLALPVFKENAASLTRGQLEESRIIDLLAMSGISQAHLLNETTELLRHVAAAELQSEQESSEMSMESILLSQEAKAITASRSKWSSRVFMMLVVAATLLVIYWRFRSHRSIQRSSAFERASGAVLLDDFRQKQELSEVLEFFELPEDADVTALRKVYRERVRRYHPDVSGEDAEKFLELQQRYEKARQLLGNA